MENLDKSSVQRMENKFRLDQTMENTLGQLSPVYFCNFPNLSGQFGKLCKRICCWIWEKISWSSCK